MECAWTPLPYFMVILSVPPSRGELKRYCSHGCGILPIIGNLVFLIGFSWISDDSHTIYGLHSLPALLLPHVLLFGEGLMDIVP
jgi:hypothetical protein